jgi:hypothetical protein
MDSVSALLFIGCGSFEVASVFALLLLKIIAITIEEMVILTINTVARELVDMMHAVLKDCSLSVSVEDMFIVIG